MIIAVPFFKSRVSPVFDVAHLCLIARCCKGSISERREVRLEGMTPRFRVAFFEKEGVALLICGGITETTRLRLERAGIRVMAGIAGDVAQAGRYDGDTDETVDRSTVQTVQPSTGREFAAGLANGGQHPRKRACADWGGS